MYVLRCRNIPDALYVSGSFVYGFNRTEDIDHACRFRSVTELLQFVSQHEPSHKCGNYDIVRIREKQNPHYEEAGVVQ